MYVESVLVQAAELKQVVAMNEAEVVTNGVVVSVPVARADILCVHIIRDQRILTAAIGGIMICRTALSSDLNRSGQAGELRRGQRRIPLPKISRVAIVEIVGESWRNVCRKPGHVIGRHERP